MSITKLGENQKLMKEGVIAFPDNEEPYIVGSRCKKCGALHFPKTTLCTDCYSEDVEDAALSRDGTIYAITRVELGVRGFKTPYLLGWVDIDDSNSRLAAQIDWDPERYKELKSGMRVRLSVDVLRLDTDGTEIVGYKFKPVIC